MSDLGILNGFIMRGYIVGGIKHIIEKVIVIVAVIISKSRIFSNKIEKYVSVTSLFVVVTGLYL